MLRNWLIGSLAVNVVLFALIAFFGYERSAMKQDLAAQSKAQSSAVNAPAKLTVSSSVAPQGIMNAYELAKKSGLSPQIADRFLAAGLIEAFSQAVPAEEYWTSARDRTLRRARQRFQLDEKVRGAALKVLGPTAAENAAFKDFFYPLGPQFSFLSSDKQLAIQKLKLQAQENPASQISAPSKILDTLAQEEAFQYSLRDSRTAQMLAASGFDFTEKEFIGVFKVLWNAGSNSARWTPMANVGASSPENNVMQLQIRAALGEERFKAFRRFQDPTYRLLNSIAKLHGYSDEAAQSAYDAIDHSNEEITRIRLKGPLLKAGQIKAIEESSARRDAELKKILGEPAFSEISRAMAMQRAPLASFPSMRSDPAVEGIVR